MICEYRNKLDLICTYIADVEERKPATETDLGAVIGLTVVTFLAIVILSWWMIPLRYIIPAIPNPRFCCKKEG